MGSDGIMVKQIGSLPSTDNSRIFDITVRVKPNITAGTNICNIAKLMSGNAVDVTTPKICVTVLGPPGTTQQPPATPLPPQPEVPPGSTKSVKNVTRNLEGTQAIQTTVQGGDVIEYKLVTANSNSSKKTNYDISDYVGDVLDYATLDTDFLASEGGTYNDTTKQVIWSNQTLPANGQLEKKIRVTIKNPIPSTNSPTQTSTSFDCTISNKYGEEISMNVACPALKTVETLPNTGPGETIAVAFGVTMVSSYFFARSRLLSKELGIVKKNYTAVGAQ